MIPAQRQVVQGHPGLQSKFQDSEGYTEKPYLKQRRNFERLGKEIVTWSLI